MMLLLGLTSAAAAAGSCVFCALNAQGAAINFDFSSLPAGTWSGTAPPGDSEYTVTNPCSLSDSPQCGTVDGSMTQSCKSLGTLANISLALTTSPAGLQLTMHGGFDGASASSPFTIAPARKRAR